MASHRQEPGESHATSAELPAVIESSDQANRFSIGAIWRWMKKHPKTTAGIGGGVAATVAGTIWAANVARGPVGDGPTTIDTHTSAPLDPSESPAPVDSEPPVDPAEAYNYNISEADVNALIDQGQEAILQMPIEQRMIIPQYYAQEELVQVATDFHRVSKDPNDQLPAGGLTAQSSAKDVAAFLFQMQNVMYSRPSIEDPYFIDVATSKAIAAGFNLEGSGSVSYVNEADYIDKFADQQLNDEVNRTGVPDGVSLANTGIRIPKIVESSIVKGGTEKNPSWTFQTESGSTIVAVWMISTAGSGMWVQANG